MFCRIFHGILLPSTAEQPDGPVQVGGLLLAGEAAGHAPDGAVPAPALLQAVLAVPVQWAFLVQLGRRMKARRTKAVLVTAAHLQMLPNVKSLVRAVARDRGR